jgi:hypothetical protein
MAADLAGLLADPAAETRAAAQWASMAQAFAGAPGPGRKPGTVP